MQILDIAVLGTASVMAEDTLRLAYVTVASSLPPIDALNVQACTFQDFRQPKK
jgi:hypothetical protein